MNLISLVPGVVPQGDTSGASQVNGSFGKHTITVGWSNYQIGGSIAGYQSQYVDGAPVNTLGQNYTALVPTQDAVQEFKVATNAVSAEFGRLGGGVVNMTTKSGQNAFHGSAYEYLRNTVLNANYFFTKNGGLPRAAFHQNQFGTVISGPIKRDKAFFFFSWERFTVHLRSPFTSNVPTQAMQNGVFSKNLSTHAQLTISDPGNVCANKVPGGIVHDSVAGTYTIPAGCIDATSKVMAKYFPLPNSTSANNWVNNSLGGDTSDQYNSRVDYNISNKQRFFGRYTYWPLIDIGAANLNNANGFRTSGGTSYTHGHSAVLGDTYTVTPTTIADLRLSYIRQRYTNDAGGIGSPMAQFGPAYAALASQVSIQTLPEMIFSGADNLFNFTPISGHEDDFYNTYALNASVSKILGVHSLKFGGEIRLMERGAIGNFPNAGSEARYNNATVGDEFAAFLLGEFTFDNIQTVIRTNTFNWSQALFATDTWQVNRALTLDLGVRWEVPGTLAEAKDRTTVILPNKIDPVTGFQGAVSLVKSSLWAPRGMEPTHYTFVDPRVGFALRLPASGALRGGYGLMYTSPDMPSGTMAFNSPVAAAVTTSTNLATAPTYFQANPFPNGILQPSGRSNPNFAANLTGQVATGPVPTSNYPYMQQWNLSLSKQWRGDWLTEVDYAGAKGTHLAMNGFSNQGYDTVGLDEISAATYTHSVTDPTTGAIVSQGGIATVGPDAGLALTANSTAPNSACAAWAAALSSPGIVKKPTVGQCLRPFPQFQDYQNGADYSGSSTYHALLVSVVKRFRGGGVLNANWTWAKMIDDTDSVDARQVEPSAGPNGLGGYFQDFNNKKGERSISGFNTKQRFVLSYVLNMPFGQGQRFLNTGGIVNVIAGGWALNGITTFQTGFPLELQVASNTLTTNFGGGTLRPNYVPGCNKQAPGTRFERFVNKTWFNAACFTNPGNFAFGNEPRVDSSVAAQGIDNFDFSVAKTTKIREAMNVEFRMEFFNLFNHTQFLAPGATIGGSNYNTLNNTANTPRLAQASLRFNF
jgi:hypothetical protein